MEGGGAAPPPPSFRKTSSPSPGMPSATVTVRWRQGVGAGCPVRFLAIQCPVSRSFGTGDSFTRS